MKNKPMIMQVGTFDVDNYGDLLFPKALSSLRLDIDFDYVSFTNRVTVFEDAIKPMSISEVDFTNAQKVLIGGGNIVSIDRGLSPEYRSIFSYGRFLARSCVKAIWTNTPYYFIGPSINNSTPRHFEGLFFANLFKYSNGGFVRDDASLKFIHGHGIQKISVSSDIVFAMYTCVEHMVKSGNMRNIALHFNQRYASIDSIKNLIDNILADPKIDRVRLLPIGICHGDLAFLHEVYQSSNAKNDSRCELINPKSLSDITNVLMDIDTYIGSSMHGYIVSSIFGAKTALILDQHPYAKFSSCVNIINPDQYIVSNLTDFDASLLSTPNIKSIKQSGMKVKKDMIDIVKDNTEVNLNIITRLLRISIILNSLNMAIWEKLWLYVFNRLTGIFKR